MKKNKNKPFDPVIIITVGVTFLAVAFMLLVKPQSLAGDSSAMPQLMVAFVTGLTTGGLSCLAVQGGLLASSLAHQIEQDYVAGQATKKAASPRT
ncbi:MAG TPA: hypothetical protein PKM54_14740, partial [Anaerolineales bacterium]|nr:hypothetical protein [Anaerolineales bacterium]